MTDRTPFHEEWTNEDVDRLSYNTSPETLLEAVNVAFEEKTGKRFQILAEGKWNITDDTIDLVVDYDGIALLPTEFVDLAIPGRVGREFLVETLSSALAARYKEDR